MEHNLTLLVDDSRMDIMIASKQLERSGLTEKIKSFMHPEEGIEWLSGHKEDLLQYDHVVLLLDINMPFINGFQFLEKIKDMPCAGLLKVYMLSSSAYQEDISHAVHESLVSGYLEKPLKPNMIPPVFDFASPSLA